MRGVSKTTFKPERPGPRTVITGVDMGQKKFSFLITGIIVTGILLQADIPFAQDKASSSKSAAVLDLDELISEALTANPDITASQKKRDAQWERPPQAKAWEDLRLEFGVRNVPADDARFSKIDMTMKEVALSQSIPMPGITSLREKIAIQEAKSADRMHDYTRLQITREVKKAYFELYLVNRHIATAEKNKGLLKQFVEIAQAKYAVGKAVQQDVLKAQVELSEFIERLIQFKQQKATVIAELNRLLARDDAAPLLGQPVLPEHKITQSATELAEAAKAGNPGLLSLQEMIARNEADYQLARKSYVPEIMVTGAYGQRENAHRTKATPTVMTEDGRHLKACGHAGAQSEYREARCVQRCGGGQCSHLVSQQTEQEGC